MGVGGAVSRFSTEFLFACALIVLALHRAGFPEPRRPEIVRVCASTALPSKDLMRLTAAAFQSGDVNCAERLARRALWLAEDDAARAEAETALAPVLAAGMEQTPTH